MKMIEKDISGIPDDGKASMDSVKYSVLMSVYKNEKADYLRMSMNSMWTQTVEPDEFVLICDGKLTDELDQVITEMEKDHPEKLRVIRHEKNRGLGMALQEGVQLCRNELIARMDSDDIAMKDRCEKELAVFAKKPEISIVGGFIEEFKDVNENGYPSETLTVRAVPETAEEIYEFAKKRNPFNHPTVMYKKSDVLRAGNYSDVRYMQDYYLWVHMLMEGEKGYNIQEPLVWMRVSGDLYKRRSGKLYRDIQIDLFRYMKEKGYITNIQYLSSVAIRSVSSVAPNWLRRMMFNRVLRKHEGNHQK